MNGGGEAVAAVKNQKEDEKLDLVLMDIQMPEVKLTNLKSTFPLHFWKKLLKLVFSLRNPLSAGESIPLH